MPSCSLTASPSIGRSTKATASATAASWVIVNIGVPPHMGMHLTLPPWALGCQTRVEAATELGELARWSATRVRLAAVDANSVPRVFTCPFLHGRADVRVAGRG